MTDLVSWLHQAMFNYDELDDERLGLIDESEVTRKCKEAANEIMLLSQQATQRGARMQVMRKWMRQSFPEDGNFSVWEAFVFAKPEAAEWFDEEGVPL